MINKCTDNDGRVCYEVKTGAPNSLIILPGGYGVLFYFEHTPWVYFLRKDLLEALLNDVEGPN